MKVKIATKDGTEEFAEARGVGRRKPLFVYHSTNPQQPKGRCGFWTVTHAPSGMSMYAMYLTQKEARQAAGELQDLLSGIAFWNRGDGEALQLEMAPWLAENPEIAMDIRRICLAKDTTGE